MMKNGKSLKTNFILLLSLFGMLLGFHSNLMAESSEVLTGKALKEKFEAKPEEWKGKTVQVKDKVCFKFKGEEVSFGEINQATETATYKSCRKFATCFANPASIAKAKTLKIGDTITVEGKVEGKRFGTIEIKDCQIK